MVSIFSQFLRIFYYIFELRKPPTCRKSLKGRWLSPYTPVYSTNKNDRHDITEILLKVALNTISLNHQSIPPLLIYDVLRRVTQRVPHVEQELLSFPEHLGSPWVFSGIRVAQSLVFCAVCKGADCNCDKRNILVVICDTEEHTRGHL